MKALLLASTAVMLSGAAFAADLPARLPVKAPIVAAAPYSWTGCYVGAHTGAGWGRSGVSDPNVALFGASITSTPGDTIGIDGASAVVGGQVGCDDQFANNWVIGLAGDFSWANIDASETDPFFTGKSGGPIPLHAKTDFQGTATGRLGYAWDRYLLYAKGGAAWAHTKYSFDNLFNFNNSFCAIGVGCFVTASETRLGWTAGAGFEWAFTNNWSAFAEFDYYGFANHAVTFTSQIGTSAPYDVKQSFEVAKIGVNYRFGTPFH